MISLLLLYLAHSPPYVPPYNGLHSTSLFKLHLPAFHHTVLYILLLYLNFPPAFHHTMVSIFLVCFNFPPCAPPYNGLRSASLFKLCPPKFHHTMVYIHLNFPPLGPCVPPYNGLPSTSLFKLSLPLRYLKNGASKLKNGSFSARLPSKIELRSSKRKLFCETSFN